MGIISKAWCFLFGHKLWQKAHSTLLPAGEGYYYRWEKQKFCRTCGWEPEAPAPGEPK